MRFASAFSLISLGLCLFAPFALACAASAYILWDQLSASDYGFASQDFEEVYDCYDCLAADDFEVPDPGWIIDTVEFDLQLYYGSQVPVYGVHIYIMPDRGDNLGDYDHPVYYEFAPVDTVYNGTNTVTLATPVALDPGHYFFGAAPAFDFESYSQCFFLATTYAPVGQEMQMINPGGCFGCGTDWFEVVPGYDASFRLYGDKYLPGAPNAVIDLPAGDVMIYPGDQVEFAGTATDEDGEVVDWLWTFGEGSGIEDMHSEDPGLVQFDNVGVFTVTFNAQDNEGKWDPSPDKRTVTVDPGYPDAVIDLPADDVTILRHQSVEFAGTATDGNGEIVDWLWTFGEGSGIDDMHSEDPGQVQFDNVGVFTVTFNARDDEGNWDPTPDQRAVTVEPIVPEAVIDLPVGDVTVHTGDYVEFAGTATDEDGEIVGWLWTFGEGSGIADMHVEDPGLVQFNKAGVFTVTFNAQDNDGNWDPTPDKRTVTVTTGYPDAVIDTPVGNVSVYPGDCVEFAGTATDEDGEVVDWLWTFGDGSGIEDMHVEDPGLVQFNNIGIFTVTFNAQDNDGNWDPTPDSLTVKVNAGHALWNQLGDSGYAFASQDFETAYDCYDCMTADDFTVPAGGWAIACVEFDMLLYYGSSAPVHGIDIRFMRDRGDNHGDWNNPVYAEVNPVGTVYDGSNLLRLRHVVWLSPGHYFFGAAPKLDFSSYSQCFFVMNDLAPQGQQAFMINPGGCFGMGSDWFQPTPGYDASFALYGDLTGPDEPDAVIDLPSGDVSIYAGDKVEFAGTATDYDGYIVDWLWTFGEGSGIDDMHVEDPGQVQFDNPGVFEVTFNAQDNDGYWDPSPDHRTITVVDLCTPTSAPDPEPYCEGALFGRPAGGYPGWVWFSIPLDPSDCCGQGNCYDPETLLGFTCGGRLWYWDRYAKSTQVYKPPFVRWDLAVGDGYLLYLEADVENPGYYGVIPDPDFRVKLGRQGWTWVGMPGLVELGYPEFMGTVQVEYPGGGAIRTAGEDYAEAPNNWVSWGWSFWDTCAQAPRAFTPYAMFGCNTCYPWIGYRVWVNVGTAQSEDDPDQVTLVWPKL